MTEQSEIIEIGSLAEVITHARREIDAGDMGRLLSLMAVAEEIGGEDGAQMVYANVIRPRLMARWDAWLRSEPGAVKPSDDEARMIAALVMENASPEQLDQILALADEMEGPTP